MARYGRGETPKLNEEQIKFIASAIRSGEVIERAVELGGISKDTLCRWLLTDPYYLAKNLIKRRTICGLTCGHGYY
jgi:hypothetical protein